MSNKNSIAAPTFANGSAAILGGFALEFAAGLEQPLLKEYAIYVVPAFTIFLAYIFNILASLSAMSVTELVAIWSSRGYFKELKDQISDPLTSEARREEKRKEYEEALDAKLAMKKGKFSIFNAANQRATKQAEKALQHAPTQTDREALEKQTKEFQQTTPQE
ncbi:TPA: hypothetical protein NGT43_001291 [Vibrio parahaemolyticus]|uniref:Uncharacterized protein n=2 Tax=Vibrio TaxID=662 RepID=A0A3Q0L1X6_VIBVU|nr:hypothetical protein [Vibrio vulnificus]EGR1335473.1 hypothetical protein [Vibrio parahaemolyticus]AAO08905.1 hypothetical protein VV1_0381 [Vibrio vulnificus CMCP6]EJB8585714.1 hypothetical protein [Vibrio parahaemolyticus]EJE4202734.1 hypothetical protein [Vibrio parahaemolyticus]EJE8521970.1 hypothetical protein [Vibrio parahaemolyticus]